MCLQRHAAAQTQSLTYLIAVRVTAIAGVLLPLLPSTVLLLLQSCKLADYALCVGCYCGPLGKVRGPYSETTAAGTAIPTATATAAAAPAWQPAFAGAYQQQQPQQQQQQMEVHFFPCAGCRACPFAGPMYKVRAAA